jgi:Holliday junction resolvasome RuvABC endonuclease subunit
MHIPLSVIEPSRVKKIATGKGNADKQVMYESFEKESFVDFKSILSPKDTVESCYGYYRQFLYY